VTYRVVQWATGAVGKTCLRAVLDHPDLDLAGLYVYAERKAGQDAGTIARYPAAGIIATRDRAEILALDADVVIHTARLQLPYERHDEDLCALLRSGKNVITTAGHHYPAAHGPARLAMFDQAGRAGGATLYGTGMNPGYVLERLVLGLTGVCTDVRRIEVTELLNAATMPDPDFVFTVMGMGSDPARLDLQAGPLAVLYGRLYGEAIAFVADRMNVPLDEIRPDHTVLPAERDLKVSAGHIPAGTVAATQWRWHAISGGRRFLTLSVIWTMDPELDGYAGRHHWTVELAGRPDLHLTLDMSDPPGTGLRTRAGQYVTAGAVINAIPAVVAAPPGVFTPPVFAPFARPLPGGFYRAALGGSPPTWICDPCSSRPHTEQCRTGVNVPPQLVWVSTVAGPSGARNHLSPQFSMTMTCGKKARPLSVSRYSTRPELALVSRVSSTPIRQKVRSRSETMAGGAPIMVSMSVNRWAPRNAAAMAEADQRLPISSMVCSTSPGPGEPPVERRRVVACGTDRAKPPLGPNVPRTSRIPAGWPQARQCMTGENSSPQAVWYMAGSGSMCSVTQVASHDQMVSSTCHRSRPRSVSTYS
jgi:hypothetical protein